MKTKWLRTGIGLAANTEALREQWGCRKDRKPAGPMEGQDCLGPEH